MGTESEGYCALALGWFVTPSSAPWVLGVTFMRQYFTAYDFDNDEIGFALSSFAERGDYEEYLNLGEREPLYAKSSNFASGVCGTFVLVFVWVLAKIVVKKYHKRRGYEVVI